MPPGCSSYHVVSKQTSQRIRSRANPIARRRPLLKIRANPIARRRRRKSQIPRAPYSLSTTPVGKLRALRCCPKGPDQTKTKRSPKTSGSGITWQTCACPQGYQQAGAKACMRMRRRVVRGTLATWQGLGTKARAKAIARGTFCVSW